MKKTTSKFLTKRLTQYGALTAAIAGIANASGQGIVYTDINPDSDGTTTLSNTPILIDMDNDGTHEFDIRLRNTVNLQIFPNSTITGASVLGNSLGGSNDNYNYPFALDNGFVISNAKTAWINSASQILVFNNCSYTGSDYNQWCGVSDKYLGLRFQIAGQTHYGWARLSVRATGELPEDWILKDYAYNSVAEASIMAGEGGTLGIIDNTISKIKISAFNKSIVLSNLPNRTEYRVFNMSGQSVLNGKASSNKYVIEANTLAKGIYIIELKDPNSSALIRKKIAL